MTRPRKALISLASTPYYHITSRCVRRAFLCGQDQSTGRDYEHRRQWIVERIRLLSSLFAIDICSYAVMSNHYHLVLKICPGQIRDASPEDIITRWCSIFKGPLLVQKYRAGERLSAEERDFVSTTIELWRERLTSISWLMKCLNQTIARQANSEDQCTGHFWESRFKSQSLSTEEALLSCMSYVDLNPVRAKLATTPESSDYTSVQERITPQFDLQQAIESQTALGLLLEFSHPLKPLLAFGAVETIDGSNEIPCAFDAYLELVDWTGRIVRADKRGSIALSTPPILERLAIDEKRWLSSTTAFELLHDRRFNRSAVKVRAA